ncbi:hypothetical protein ACYSNM_12895 [Myroides sp. LJL116]
MKKISIIMLLGVFLLQSFGLKEDKTNTQVSIEQLKKMDKEPIFYLNINSTYGYEILINGFPISRNSSTSGKYTTAINNYLFKKGIQDIEIEITPISHESGNQAETFKKDGFFELDIEQRHWTQDNVLSEPKNIFSYKMPNQENSHPSKYIHKASFKANVPYKLADWHNGKTFTEQDSIVLIPKVLEFYENLKYAFEHQEGEKYMELLGQGFFNGFQANYQTSEQSMEYYNHNTNFINEKQRKLEPLENYRLLISGNGKLLSLRRVDGFNKGEGVLRFQYKRRGQLNTRIEDIVLYCPQSSNSEEYNFKVIWYMNQNKGVNQ